MTLLNGEDGKTGFKKLCAALVSTALLASCVSLSQQDELKADELRRHGLSVPLSGPKNIFLAGGLNVFGGMGNFYLSYGKDGDSYQALYGIANLLFFMISPLWSVPQAMIDAYSLNKKAFVDYYSFSDEGLKEIQRLNPDADGRADYREPFDDDDDETDAE